MDGKRMAMPLFSMLIMVQFTLLLIEFVIGMTVNLYVSIPEPLKGSFFMSSSAIAILVHIGLGALVAVLGVLIFFMALMQGNRRNILFTAFAFIFVVAAAINGLVFLFDGQNPAFSLFMAVFFIFAFSAYLFPLAQSVKGQIQS